METLDAIFSRRSIRRYTSKDITDEQVTTLLRAAMAAPTTVDNRDWAFVVIRDKTSMEKIMAIKPGNADMLREAPVAILVCGDLKLAYSSTPDYWIQDCAAATENILIAGTGLGIGSVWLGVYPNMNRVKALQELFHLPDHIIPFAVVSLGDPAEVKPPANRYDPSKVHYERW